MTDATETIERLGTLTAEEIQTLQVDAALRLLLQIDAALPILNEALIAESNALVQADADVNDAKSRQSAARAKVQNIKNTLRHLSSRRSILQTVCRATR